MVPQNGRNAPATAIVIADRAKVSGKGERVVVSASELKKVAEYAAKHGDGTILIDVVSHTQSLYCEIPVDECGVAQAIIVPCEAKDISDPYKFAVKITER